MSVLANRPQRTRARSKQRSFAITFTIEGDQYVVSRLPAHPDVAQAAYRFRKLTGDQATYDLRISEHGEECECLGFLRHGHCKHGMTIQAASKVFNL